MEARNMDTEGWGVTLPPLPPVHTASHHGGQEQGYRGVGSDPASSPSCTYCQPPWRPGTTIQKGGSDLAYITWREKAEVTLSTAHRGS